MKLESENKVKAKRIERGFTQEQLAEKVGIKVRYLAYIESGERTPSLIVAKKLAAELNSNLGELF